MTSNTPKVYPISAALRALTDHQRQLDQDGVEVGVSREALDLVMAELREAWIELRCCDDINLDKGVASGIAELQTDRERAWARERKLRVALEGLRHWADQFTPAPAYVSGFCELIIDVDAVLWADAQLEPPGPSCDRCMGPALGDRCLDHRSGMRTCDQCAGRLSDRDLGGPCEECGAPGGDLHAENCPKIGASTAERALAEVRRVVAQEGETFFICERCGHQHDEFLRDCDIWWMMEKVLGAEAAGPAIGPSHRLDEPVTSPSPLPRLGDGG